jgi:hypothetical protein
VINLDKPTNDGSQVELVVAGATVGHGRVCHVGRHRFGIELREVCATIERELPIRTTDVFVSESDAALPFEHLMLEDKFSKNQVRNVSLIHERFVANLREAFPSLSEWHVCCVDQVSFGDLTANWLQDTEVALLEAIPRRPRSEEGPGHRYYLEPDGAKRKLSAEAIARLADSQQASDRSSPLGRIVFAWRRESELAGIVNAESWPIIIASLRNAWKQRYAMADVSARIIDHDGLAGTFTALEHFLVSQIGVRGTDRLATIAYPSVYVERIAGLLE